MLLSMRSGFDVLSFAFWGDADSKPLGVGLQKTYGKDQKFKTQVDLGNSFLKYLTIIFKAMSLFNVLFIHSIYYNDEQL